MRGCIVTAAVLVPLLLLGGAGPAAAVISTGSLIDGPSADLRELGGVTMSADGTGGIVYRKDVGGRAHVFAAQYVDGAWQPPQRVDQGQAFDSSWPVIAAGDGGRLVVVWVQEFGAADRMYSAALEPGARRFEPPVPVDLNVGDASLGTWPAVSMAPGGQAYLVYRVITDAQPATTPPGTVLGEYRLARFTGQLWSGYGGPINRNPGSAQATPSEANRPQVGADQLGNAVTAWQELDDQFVSRVYARRVFPGSTGIALQVTPATLGGGPLRGAVDRFVLDVGRYGETAISWLQTVVAGDAFDTSRLLVATSPDSFSPDAARFTDPRTFDGTASQTPAGVVTPGSIAVSGADVLATFGVDATVRSADADETTVRAPSRIDSASGEASSGAGDLGGSGAAAFAWAQSAAGRGSAILQERRSDGVTTTRSVSGPRGGQTDRVRLSGSGLGDALVGFAQGKDAGRQIVAAVIDAPPDTFNVQAPIGWVRGRSVALRWDPAVHAIGDVRYDVVVDDDTVASGLTGTTYALPTTSLDDGLRAITIIATDAAGQETTSVPAQLKLDRSAPTVRVGIAGRRVRVVVRDDASGVSGAGVATSFGDGARAAGRRSRSHVYRRAGTYRVAVRVSDRAGNRATTRRTVRAR